MKLKFIVLLMFSLTPLASTAASTDSLANQVMLCQQQQNDNKRLACFDQIKLQSVNAPVSLPPPALAAPTTSHQVPAVPVNDRPAIVQTTAPTSAPVVADTEADFGAEKLKKAEAEQTEEISSKITGVKKDALKKLTLELENGQQWSQIGSEYIRIKVGDTATVRRAALGTFLLGTDKVTKTIRVRRVK